MARILIAGCGAVGGELGQRLHAAGHPVWGLRRTVAVLPPVIQPLAADLNDPTTLTRLPPDLDYVCYTAAADGFSPDHYRAAYVDGLTHLLQALQAQGQQPRRVIFTSSTSVYGQCQGEWVDEDSPAEATGFAGRCLREAEQRLWQGPYPATVIRFGGIYGPGRTRLLDSLRQGTATCVEGVYSNRIHQADSAAALEHLLRLPEPAPLYLGVDDQPAPLCAVLRWLAARLGVAPPTVVAAATADAALLRANKRCRNQRLRASGFALRYPSYQEGYAALLVDSGR
jgi:nucleoside-diphosphate-sugar epimerase